MIKIWTLQILILFLFSPLVGASKMQPSPVQSQCSARNLRQKDCHLAVGPRKIHVWNDKIFLTTEIAHDLQPVEVPQAQDWEFVRHVQLAGRDFVEVAVWTEPKGQGEVSLLIWTVYEFDDRMIQQKAQAAIQRRKLNETSQKFVYDKRYPFGLTVKGKVIEWFADKSTGSF